MDKNQSTNKKNNRNSNIELLRCILLFLIVFYHLLLHGTNGTLVHFFEWQPLPLTAVESFSLIFCMFPVDCFVIISGYYKINIVENGRIRTAKLIKNYSPIFFYSVTIGAIYCIATGNIELKTISDLFPVLQSNCWFASCYLLLCVISPILNDIFDKYCKNRHFIILFVILGILNYCMTGSKFSELMGIGSNRFFMIVYCYFLGRFVCEYEKKILVIKRHCLLLFLVTFLIQCTLVSIQRHFYPSINEKFWCWLSLNSSPFTMFQAICIFLFFMKRKHFYNKFINILGAGSFAVYLITENTHLRKVIYTLVDGHSHKDSPFLIFYLLTAALLLFFVCQLIEFIRLYLFHKISRLRETD